MQFLRIRKIIITGESGISLLETLVALAVLGTIAVTFLSGVAISTKAAFTTDELTTAESLARTQMEWIQNADYTDNVSQYSAAVIPDVNDYSSYSVNITAEPLNIPDDGIQKITVTISRFNEQVLELEGYKIE
ncbi:hypothetical protein ACFLVZ_00070 [Chloroflexota bacterium]